MDVPSRPVRLLPERRVQHPAATLLQRSEKAIVRRVGRLRSMNTIPLVLYIHYYDNDPAFTLHRKTKSTEG